MSISKWDRKFIELAKHVSTWSKDTTKVGAVIVDDNNIVLSLGYNGFPRKADDDLEERKERSVKLLYTIHAEENAILNAARKGISLEGSTMYLQWFPCMECAKRIVNSGIKRLVCSDYDHSDFRRLNDYKFLMSESLLNECNIIVDKYEQI